MGYTHYLDVYTIQIPTVTVKVAVAMTTTATVAVEMGVTTCHILGAYKRAPTGASQLLRLQRVN